MSASFVSTTTAKIGGITHTQTKTLTGDGQIGVDVSLAAAKPATQTAYTSASVIGITPQTGHGLVTGDIVDVYWTNAGVIKSRRDVVLGTVSGNSQIATSGGTGDSFDTGTTTALTMMKQNVEQLQITGNNLQALVISVGAKGNVTLRSTGTAPATAEKAVQFMEAGVYVWHNGLVDANPISGDAILTVAFTHGDSSAARSIKVSALYS